MTFVAPPLAQHDEPIAILGVLEKAGASHRRDVLAVIQRMQEDIAYGVVEAIDAFDEDDETGLAKLLEQARGDQ